MNPVTLDSIFEVAHLHSTGHSSGNLESRLFENQSFEPRVEGREWLTSDEAADFLRVPISSLRNLTSRGKIPYFKFQRRNRYKKSDLVNLLMANPRGEKNGN